MTNDNEHRDSFQERATMNKLIESIQDRLICHMIFGDKKVYDRLTVLNFREILISNTQRVLNLVHSMTIDQAVTKVMDEELLARRSLT